MDMGFALRRKPMIATEGGSLKVHYFQTFNRISNDALSPFITLWMCK